MFVAIIGSAIVGKNWCLKTAAVDWGVGRQTPTGQAVQNSGWAAQVVAVAQSI